jgi:hypothetical protein
MLLLLIRKIEVPERKIKTGAQKWVTHLVKKSMGVEFARSVGSSLKPLR